MQEMLVIFACMNNHGCSETSSTYYHFHPELREVVEYSERKIRSYVNPFIMDNVAPFAFAAAGGTGSVKISANFRLEIRKTEGTKLVYSRGF